MSLPLFFVETIDPSVSSIVLNEDTSRHVVQVLRKACGESIQLTDGKGTLISASIIDAHKKKCIVQINKVDKTEASQKNITIAISLVKNTARFEWFLEKATEIGVTSIIPLICERTEKQHFRYDRMKGILISAMLQSKQTWLPELKEPMSYKEAVKNCAIRTKYIAHCENTSEKKRLQVDPIHNSAIILIGPEGDFSDEEISLALSNGFLPVSLGDTRLRTETAGVVAAVLSKQ
jgi:16S rRNA (uracil1498-N3)-methyltransferase